MKAPDSRDRRYLMDREEATLAPYAQLSRTSAGRRRSEAAHPYRTAFQRDCARIIHSRAFRRLEAKTQVFVSGTSDHFRTRLTHTMEVASISRALARALGVNEDLAEAIALGHDVGHPPFAHAGETLLNEKMAGHGGFSHNSQSLRVLDVLERKYPDVEGLNLTFEVLEGFRKHQVPALRAKARQAAREGKATGEAAFPLLEAQIADLADEIAYYSHDLDDGLDSQLLTVENLRELPLWRSVEAEALARRPGASGRELALYTIRCLIDREVADVIDASIRRLRAWRIETLEDVRRCREPIVAYSPGMRKANAGLRRFLFANLYYHPRVLERVDGACELLSRVFDAYLENPEHLGRQATSRIGRDGLHRVVCDYIAGMTDRFLVAEFCRLFPDGGGLSSSALCLVEKIRSAYPFTK